MIVTKKLTTLHSRVPNLLSFQCTYKLDIPFFKKRISSNPTRIGLFSCHWWDNALVLLVLILVHGRGYGNIYTFGRGLICGEETFSLLLFTLCKNCDSPLLSDCNLSPRLINIIGFLILKCNSQEIKPTKGKGI